MAPKITNGTIKCGWCLTGHHQHCKVESTPWYGKTWKCSCDCDKTNVTPPVVHKGSFVTDVVEYQQKPTTRTRRRPAVEDEVAPLPKANTRRRSKADEKVAKVAEKELKKVLDSEEIKRGVREIKEVVK